MSKEGSASTSKVPDWSTSISSSSLVDLKGELLKQQIEFSKTAHLGRTIPSKKRPLPSSSTSSSSIFSQKRNKGLSLRQQRDADALAIQQEQDGRNPDRAKEMLEKKAKLYDKIRKGKTGGLTEGQRETLLVDFDKRGESSEKSESEDEDESLTVPKKPRDEDEKLVEWTDEFGRTRWVPESEVPREVHVEPKEVVEVDESNIRYGDQEHFPVYTPSFDVLAARKAALESAAPLVQHYSAVKENRAKGAGFYAFSSDEKEREKQMEALKRDRERTERERERGAGVGSLEDDKERERLERKKKVEEKREELRRRREEKSKEGS